MINLIKYLPKDNSEKHKKEYETLGSLKLLYDFIQNNMQGIDVQFFEKLKEFVDKRNSAAHPGELTFQEAGVFWNDYKTLPCRDGSKNREHIKTAFDVGVYCPYCDCFFTKFSGIFQPHLPCGNVGYFS